MDLKILYQENVKHEREQEHNREIRFAFDLKKKSIHQSTVDERAFSGATQGELQSQCEERPSHHTWHAHMRHKCALLP